MSSSQLHPVDFAPGLEEFQRSLPPTLVLLHFVWHFVSGLCLGVWRRQSARQSGEPSVQHSFARILRRAPTSTECAIKLNERKELVHLRLHQSVLRREKQLLLLQDFVITGATRHVALA